MSKSKEEPRRRRQTRRLRAMGMRLQAFRCALPRQTLPPHVLPRSMARVRWLSSRRPSHDANGAHRSGVPDAAHGIAVVRRRYTRRDDVYVTVSAILVIAAALAAYLPARRVTRIDPMQALRAE